jgi:hypothetical protein
MITINIDPSLELVTVKLVGTTTANDILLAMSYLASSDLWRDHYNYFIDIREIIVGFSIAEHPLLMNNLHKLKPLKHTKHACVVGGHTHYAFTLAWEKIAALHGVRFKSSFSCDSLSEWLSVSVSKITKTLESEPLFTFSTDPSELQPQC